MEDDFWARPLGLIPCKNGVLEWESTGPILKPHSPKYHFRGLLAVDYDPKAECPRFMEFLNQALPNDDVELLQRIVGSILLGRNVAQRFTMLMGTPQSGKGVIARIVTALVGPENVTTLRTNALSGRFEIGRFVNKLLLYAPDVSSRFLHEVGAHLLKAITGEDPFSPEYKGSNVTPPAKPLSTGILITCNSRLTIHLEGDKGAWERRLIAVSFDKEGVTEEKQIAGLSEMLLRDEGAGILNWALEGLEAFILDDYKLRLSERQRAVVSDLLSQSESCTCFARGCLVREEGGGLPVKAIFLRQLPSLMESVFHVRKCHHVERAGRRQRGFKGVGLRMDSGSPAVPEIERE